MPKLKPVLMQYSRTEIYVIVTALIAVYSA